MRNRYSVIPILVLTGALSGATGASDAVRQPRVALLELYTSEGCNSCPPMDRWISQLPQAQLVPQKLVVLAFHVDYWNYLGWPDRFSQARFTQRQRSAVHSNGLRTAYTPQLLLNGRDYREQGALDAHLAPINAQTARVHLNLLAKNTASGLMADVLIEPRVKPGESLHLYLAVYENNLHTEVKAGENRGQRLRHDFVVRSLIGPMALAPTETTRWKGSIPLSAEWKVAELGLAVFVQSVENGEVIQATAQAIRETGY